MALEIQHYRSAHQFLRDFWEHKHQKNPSVSLRTWSKALGLKSHAPLHLMMKGQRGIPKKMLPKLIQEMKLDADQGLFFETLAEMDRAKTPERKLFYLERLKTLSSQASMDDSQGIQWTEIEHYHAIRNPLSTLLLEMCQLPDFEPDPHWVLERVRIQTTVKEIEATLERLIVLGLLEEGPEGTLKRTHRHFRTTPDFAHQAIQEHHQAVSRLAAELIETQSVDERNFESFSFNIDPKSLPQAKKRIRKFIDQLVKELELSAGDLETYQLNVQFFPLTKSRRRTR